MQVSFEAQPWTAIAALLISLSALGVAAFSLWISWRRDRREVKAAEPTAYTIVKTVPDEQNWYEVAVTIKNRSPDGFGFREIRFLWPPTARGLRFWDAHAPRDSAGKQKLLSPLPRDKAQRVIALNVPLSPAGMAAPLFRNIRMGPGDDHVETLLVFARRSIVSRTLSMRLVLFSMSPIERRIVITAVRMLPQAIKTAKA